MIDTQQDRKLIRDIFDSLMIEVGRTLNCSGWYLGRSVHWGWKHQEILASCNVQICRPHRDYYEDYRLKHPDADDPNRNYCGPKYQAVAHTICGQTKDNLVFFNDYTGQVEPYLYLPLADPAFSAEQIAAAIMHHWKA